MLRGLLSHAITLGREATKNYFSIKMEIVNGDPLKTIVEDLGFQAIKPIISIPGTDQTKQRYKFEL